MVYQIKPFNEWAVKRGESCRKTDASSCAPSMSRNECVNCYEDYVRQRLPQTLGESHITGADEIFKMRF